MNPATRWLLRRLTPPTERLPHRVGRRERHERAAFADAVVIRRRIVAPKTEQTEQEESKP